MADNQVMHTKDRMARLQMETTLAVLGDDRRYRTKFGTRIVLDAALMNTDFRAGICDHACLSVAQYS